MYRHITVLLCIGCFLSTSGCAGFSKFHSEQTSRRRSAKRLTSQTDTTWKQGYGFNNPNNERVNQGLDPVNFDGKTDREREKKGGYFSDLAGDLLVFGVKSSYTKIASRLQRPSAEPTTSK